MNKNLIINKLNKCKAYEYGQYDNHKDCNNISKASTSTKTQQSPQLHQLNPQFTFKASQLKKIIPSKTKISQFFQNFNPTQQVVYQKVVLLKQKAVQRPLEFQLMNLFREGQKKSQQTAIKKLNFSDDQEVDVHRTSLENKMQIQQNQEKLYAVMKTEYIEPRDTQRYLQAGREEYFKNDMPYDCKKYKLQRDKQCNSKQLLVRPQVIKRCQTQVQTGNLQPPQGYFADVYYQTIHNASKPFNDYNFKSLELQENQQDFFNQYYFQNNQTQQSEHQNQKEQIMKQSHTAGIQLTKRQGNSSRLSFFRKQRQHQIRKSLLQEFNQSNHNHFRSFDNKQNIKSCSKFIPTLALKNPLQPNKKLQSQFSQRQLLDRRNLQQNFPNKKFSHLVPKSTISYMNKDTESRILSIRKQLKNIYQVREKDRSKLKIKRDQQLFDQNSNIHLRRVGSICKF